MHLCHIADAVLCPRESWTTSPTSTLHPRSFSQCHRYHEKSEPLYSFTVPLAREWRIISCLQRARPFLVPRTPEANQRIRDAQRAKILECARRVFARKGMDATITDIATEAQISLGLA
ncbi:MAG: TetR family transcriptional regulator, partial [Ktedonobacteraceae bacterium]|nr:TetR family transcriptional regulator [Ktedonobacteraceae bacterium]